MGSRGIQNPPSAVNYTGSNVIEHQLEFADVREWEYTRPTWDRYFMRIAETVSLRASCPRASVGVVIVSADKRILATGYNGAPPGVLDCLTIGCDIVDEMWDDHCQRAIHAEVNAIGHAARHGVELRGGKLYMWGYDRVCRECMKVINAVGLDVYVW